MQAWLAVCLVCMYICMCFSQCLDISGFALHKTFKHHRPNPDGVYLTQCRMHVFSFIVYAISFLFLLASSLFSLCYIFPLPLPPGIFLVQSMLYLPSSSSSWHLSCSVNAISSLFLLASLLFSLCYIFPLPLPPGIFLVQSMLYLPSSSSSWHLPCLVYAISSLFLFLLASP